MDYRNSLYTREELLEKVAAKMSAKRFQHVLGVEKMAVHLAKKYQADIEKASIAGIVHDYAKEFSDECILSAIKNHHLDAHVIPYGNNIWHGVIGVFFIQKELYIEDKEVLHAVKIHTTGAEKMSLLDKILYVADFIEENRDFPGVEVARELAEKNLDEAVAFETRHTLEYLIKCGIKIYPKTLETYNAWVAK